MQVRCRNTICLIVRRCEIVLGAVHRRIDIDQGVDLKSTHIKKCCHLHRLPNKCEICCGCGRCSILTRVHSIESIGIHSYSYRTARDSRQQSALFKIDRTDIWFGHFGAFVKIFVETVEDTGVVIMSTDRIEQ